MGKCLHKDICLSKEYDVRNEMMDTCENCQQSLSGGVFTLLWEDGDKPHAFVTCRYCGHENIKYGFGGDDD